MHKIGDCRLDLPGLVVVFCDKGNERSYYVII
jgi:hypothetical protein